MSRNEAFQQCIKAFAAGDYATCMQRAMALVQERATLHTLQLLLISLQRLGREDLLNDIGPKVLEMTAKRPWDHSLLGVTLEQAEPSEVLDQAADDQQRCQAMFYIGARLVTLAAVEPARFFLAACVAQDCDCLERLLAQQELARQPTARTKLSEVEAAQQVVHLNRQALHLYGHGQYPQAASLARQALELARQHLGEDHPDTALSFNNLGLFLRAQGKNAAARPCYEQALDINRRVLGADHPQTAMTLDNLGLLLQAMGDRAAARLHHEQALEIFRRVRGNDHLDTATCLNNLGLLLQAMGDLASARPYLEEALEIQRRVLGEDHPNTATCLDNLGGLLRSLGQLAVARRCREQALEIFRRVRGDSHPDTATCLINLGRLVQEMGDLTAARRCYEQALAIFHQVSGEYHPHTATCLENLGDLLRSIGELASARPCYEQIVKIQRRLLGKDHPITADRLNQLGLLLRDIGDLERAKTCLEEALEIHQRVLGHEHPNTAVSLHNLGSLLQDMGNLAGARPFFEQALEINRQTLGDDHPATAITFDSLGSLLEAMGDLAAARPYLEQVLERRRRLLGQNHADTATSLASLGRLLHEMGELANALPYLEQALEIHRGVLGDNHLDTATSLASLGLLLRDMGDLDAAMRVLHQTWDVRRRVLGDNHPTTARSFNNVLLLLLDLSGMGVRPNPAVLRRYSEEVLEIVRHGQGEDHPETAKCLSNLAALFHAIGDFAAARSCYDQALEIKRRVLGENHPSTAKSLSALGVLLSDMGDLMAARLCCQQALHIAQHVRGEHHLETARSLWNLSVLLVASGQIDEALALMCQATAIDDRMIGQVFSIGSDRQRMLFLAQLDGQLNLFLSLAFQHLSGSPEAVDAAFDLVLRRKALGAEALAAQRDAVLGGRYPQLREAFEQLTQLRGRIAQKTLAGPAASETLAAHEQSLHQWRQEEQQRETELARQIPEMSLEHQLHKADRRAVTLSLPEGVALIEFIRFSVFDFHAVPARGEQRWQPARYLAFVLLGGQPDQVQMIDLGEAHPVDLMIADFRASVASDPQDRSERDVHRRRPGASPAAQGEVGPALLAAVFDKLLPAFGGSNRLLLAPDGDLTRLPFEILPDADGRLLLEQYRISYLSCGRDVLRFGATSTRLPADALVVADPLFDLAADGAAVPTSPHGTPRCSRDIRQCGLHFRRLPGTRAEGEQIAALLGVRPWLEFDALEGRLKEIRSPRVLHLATHGFFLEDQPHDPNKERDDLGRVGSEAASFGRLGGALPENPLLRSGLALAGAQTWLDGAALPSEAEDGLLTAEDVTGLDLLDTELVVLSACDTGLGEIRTGEGVLGLRRAFIVAGARTLVVSLWKVPDEQTRELMIDFYTRVLSGQAVADALRQAQLSMKEKYPDPYYWGAFICQGNPGPLAARAGTSPAVPARSD
jgi:tetratricopeptide (TPR) repeat protein/CHAT domain-containing protein